MSGLLMDKVSVFFLKIRKVCTKSFKTVLRVQLPLRQGACCYLKEGRGQ